MRLTPQYLLIAVNQELELPKVFFELFDVVVIALELFPPELATNHLQVRAVHPDVPPFASGDPHTALDLVHDFAGVIVDVERAELFRCEEALVFCAAIFADEAVGTGSEHTIIGLDQPHLSNHQASLDFVLHPRLRFQFVPPAHLPGFKTVIQRLAADTLYGKAECVIQSLL